MTIEAKKTVPYVCPACHEKRGTQAEYHDCCIEPGTTTARITRVGMRRAGCAVGGREKK